MPDKTGGADVFTLFALVALLVMGVPVLGLLSSLNAWMGYDEKVRKINELHAFEVALWMYEDQTLKKNRAGREHQWKTISTFVRNYRLDKPRNLKKFFKRYPYLRQPFEFAEQHPFLAD